MLSKLLKYELKSSARTLIPLYIGILIVSLACGFFVSSNIDNTFWIEDSTIGALIMLLLFALFIAMGVLTVVCIIQRFNQSLLGDEGFLMFTLPVSSTKLLWSKLLAALIWCILGGIVTCLSGVLIMSITFITHPEFIQLENFFNELQYLFSQLEINMMLAFIEMTIIGFLSIVVTILTAYLAMMIGQLQVFSKHRVAVSFIAFFLINWVFSWFIEPINRIMFQISPTGDVFFHIATATTIIETIILFFGVDFMMKRYLNL